MALDNGPLANADRDLAVSTRFLTLKTEPQLIAPPDFSVDRAFNPHRRRPVKSDTEPMLLAKSNSRTRENEDTHLLAELAVPAESQNADACAGQKPARIR
ncbi:hypothetical protein [Telmatospirillum sp.]|uniref:hypothetical protein n=1 Tax=Telmatospirillum sp. TaxID=2079197 RepID=UPI002844C6A9|nr:hypothetical protein [Telmatospirillum sp.]MDR3440606.1 hypothetical protein [Telmatospirillum sp.]